MSGRASTRGDLAEAGRRKLEAFRKQKTQAKRSKTPTEPLKSVTNEVPFVESGAKPSQQGFNTADGRSEEQHSLGPIPFGDAALNTSRNNTASAPANAPSNGAKSLGDSFQREEPSFSRNQALKLPPLAPIFRKPPPLPLPPSAARNTKPASGLTLEAEGRSSVKENAEVELPVSLHASDLNSSSADEDSLPSPAPSGYADLSDSYLSPPSAGKRQITQGAAPSTENREVESQTSSVESRASSRFSRFTNLFGKAADQLPSDLEGEKARLQPGNGLVTQLRQQEADFESHFEDKNGSNRTVGRHGRVPSLNAWNKAEDSERREESLAEQNGDTVAAPDLRSGVALSTPTELQKAKEEGSSDGLDERGNGFNFVVPKQREAYLPPLWQAPAASRRTANGTSSSHQNQAGRADSLPRTHGNTLGDESDAEPSRLPHSRGSPDSSHHSLAEASKKEAEQFSALQQHIDELTEQKFELVRGLTKQQQMAASLASENQRLLDDYNHQGQLLQQLRKELEGRDAEIGAQQMALAGLGGERDACRSAVQDTAQRAEDMAAEVVALEEKYLKARSIELQAVRRAEEAAADAQKARQQQASAAAECAELRAVVAVLQEEKQKWPEMLQRAAAFEQAPGVARTLAAAGPSKPPDAVRAAPSEPPNELGMRGAVRESEVARVVQNAWQSTQEMPSLGAQVEEGIPELLQLLLPPRAYQGFASEEAAELATEERRVTNSINKLLDSLEKEKQALLISLTAQQAHCKQLQIDNSQLRARFRASNAQEELKIPTNFDIGTPGGARRQGAMGWIAKVVAPPV